MAKQSGLGDNLYIAGYDVSGDVSTVSPIASRSGQLDVTAISASGHERIHSHVDGEIGFTSFFNDATDQEHDALKAKGSGADRIVTYLHGSAIGNAAAGLTSKQINYDMSRGADGSLTFGIQCLADGYGLDHCKQLTAGKRTDTSATGTGTSLDNAASSALGLVAYLQVFEFTGTSVTVTIQHSTDDSAWANLISFTAATAVGAERITTAALTTSVNRYLRVITTGTFSNAVFTVCASRDLYAL